MRSALLSLCFVFGASASAQTAYVGGRWFTGDGFEARDTTWATDGVFTEARPARLDRIARLGDAFVVPPFGDGHVHGFESPESLRFEDSLFVARGVFSAFNPHIPATERASVQGRRTTVDVAYAIAGFTAPGAHPSTVYEARALGLQPWDASGPRGAEIRASRLRDGDAYTLAATLDDVEAVWPTVRASGTDWIKIFLDHSDEWAGGRPARPRGLDPAVAAEITRRAHADGLRVAAHVETAEDLDAALDAGVDLLAHAPGATVDTEDPATAEGGAFVMSDAQMARLAASGIPVTPTLARGPAMNRYIPEAYRPSAATLDTVRTFHADLLRRLGAAGVPLVVGADLGDLWAGDEAAYWIERGVAPLDVLRAWSVTTPQAMFPDRDLGRFAPGAEASLLALACSPLADWTCTAQITHRETRGRDLSASRTPRINLRTPATGYTGGLWYRDGRFEARDTVWTESGVFAGARPARTEALVDLGGAYVVPPFADAHQHDIEGPWSIPMAQAHLERGSFYVKVVSNIARYTRGLEGDLNTPRTLDVAFSHAGVTSPGGHPFPLYRRLVEQGVYRDDLDADSLDGVVAFGFATVEDLERRWPDLLAQRPDHVKLLLTDAASGRGLQPDVFRRAVDLAHRAGLRATVHVFTAADLQLAVEAGADEAAHLPGFQFDDEPAVYRISPALAADMARRQFVVVTTTLVSADFEDAAPIQALQAENIRRLVAAGVPLAIGTDGWGQTGIDEAEHLVRIGALSSPEALRALVETGARSVFPDRAIGRLGPGFEASFLALACDPTADLRCARRIEARIKNGEALP